MKKGCSRTRILSLCVLVLLVSGCITRTASRSNPGSRPSNQSIKSSSLTDYVRAIYKVSSEDSRKLEQRAALLSSAPELATLLDQAEKDPPDVEARARIIREYMSRELYWGAYQLLNNTGDEHSNDPEVNMNLAVIWDAWGQSSVALEYGERGIANGAASSRDYETIGRIHLHRNDPAQAIIWYNGSLEYGRNAKTLANIGYAYMLMSEWEDARTNLEEAVASDDTLEEAHNNLAVVLSKTGDDTGALAHLLHSGQPAVAFNNMGVLYLQSKDVRNAQHYFEEALRLEPAYETARRNLDGLQSALPPPSILHLPAFRSEVPSLPSAAESSGVEEIAALTVALDQNQPERTEIPDPASPAATVDEAQHGEPGSPIAHNERSAKALPEADKLDQSAHGQRPVFESLQGRGLGLAGLAGLGFATGFLALRSRKSSTGNTVHHPRQ